MWSTKSGKRLTSRTCNFRVEPITINKVITCLTERLRIRLGVYYSAQMSDQIIDVTDVYEWGRKPLK